MEIHFKIFNHGNSLKILLVLISLLARLSAQAQIAGTVFDTSSHPIGYANVTMYSLQDSTRIAGTITDKWGQYKLENTGDASSAYLKISALGYVTKVICPITNKQTIQLQPSEYSLGEAVVSGHREIYKSRGTDIIADIQHSHLKDFGFADDIIDKLPMVSGEHGDYSIFGKGSAVVYVGNRKLSDPSELARILTKDIATIEVISNPGAKYDADTHAVIRINLKKQRAKGWGATASLSDGQGRRNVNNEHVQLTYSSEKVNTFISFSNSTSHYSTDQENTEYVLTPGSSWRFHSNMPKWKSNYYNKAVTGGISMDLNKNHTIGGQVTYQRDNDRYRGVSNNVMTQGKRVYESLISTIYSQSHYNQWQSNIYYEGHLGSKWTINYNGDYLRRESTDGKDNEETGDLTVSHTVRTTNKTTYDIAASLVEAEYQINKKATLKIGTNVSYVKDTKLYNSRDDVAARTKSSLTSKETKTALFVEGEVGIGKLNTNLGTRYELFKMSYYDDFNSQQLVDKNYSRLYPYLSMSLPVRDIKMGLSLTTKVQRPSYYQLRNSQEYFNRYETEAGNPLLLPQYTTDLSYSAQYKSLRFSMSYQWIKDYIMTSNIVDVEYPLHILSKPTNKSHYSSLSSNVSYNKTIGIWEFYTHLNVMRTFFNIYQTDGTLINGKRPYAEMSFNSYFNLKKDWMPYLLLRYNSDGYMREYRIKQGFFISMGITKHFFKNALYARLSINNILGTKERETRFDTNYKFVKERFKDNRNISLFLRYTFNNKKKYKGKSAVTEEIDRM